MLGENLLLNILYTRTGRHATHLTCYRNENNLEKRTLLTIDELCETVKQKRENLESIPTYYNT